MIDPPTGGVLVPRFHVTTFGPPPADESTLDELASGQLVVAAASSAEPLKTYSPRSFSVQEKTKLTPAPPAGTLAVAGVGPVQVAVPPLMPSSEGVTLFTAVLLLAFSVTLTAPPWTT